MPAAQRKLRESSDTEHLAATERRTPSRRIEAVARPRVLVLLATYNGERWIDEQLRSILNQDGVDVQVVIRDDCSTDATLAVVRRLESDRVTITKASTPSGSASQNFFALIRENAALGFDYVAFSDQDDSWFVDKLTRACRSLISSASVGYSSPVIAFWEPGEERVLRQNTKMTRFDFLFEGAGQGCTFALTADLYERVRDFLCRNEPLTRDIEFHDWTVYALARSWNMDWHFDSTPTMRYRQHGGNAIGAKKSVEGIRRRLSLLRSGWYKKQLDAIAKLCASAAPTRTEFSHWNAQLNRRRNVLRKLALARFCVLHGRRNATERAILLMSALSGWI